MDAVVPVFAGAVAISTQGYFAYRAYRVSPCDNELSKLLIESLKVVQRSKAFCIYIGLIAVVAFCSSIAVVAGNREHRIGRSLVPADSGRDEAVRYASDSNFGVELLVITELWLWSTSITDLSISAVLVYFLIRHRTQAGGFNEK